ncbi:uncharacterized protein ALTATR162_LOCUS12167 [Alternaria atra]|uniref:Uncharacterized protein n=1 Tax=Alternaria atra TaxID=119953 RepID=A0A8J2NC48_9PLEO|nr:uncharacterized protein ALTATR162_LOCUS12167 [Alternaria atra]CAG5190259.1 unnamed protein product [Alternaria atra]
MGALVQATMKERLIPAVVASSKDTTVVEALTTETCSSSSFRYGTFDCAVLSFKGVRRDGQEIMVKLHDGDAVDQLLEDVLITLLEIALVPAGKYVEMTYWPVDSLSNAWLRIMPKEPKSSSHYKSAVDDSTDFVDGIMFEWFLGVVVTGRITSAVDHIRSGLKDGDTFVQHAESIGSKLQGTLDTHVETRKFLQQQNKPDEIHENEDENGRESVEITASKDEDEKPTKKQRLHSGLEKGVASSGRLTEKPVLNHRILPENEFILLSEKTNQNGDDIVNLRHQVRDVVETLLKYKFDGAADRLVREQIIDQQKWLIEQHKWLIGQQQQLIAQKEQELIALKSRDVIPTAGDRQ